jgi:hypothetical protein
MPCEVKMHGLDVGSLRSKLSAVRWMHVRDPGRTFRDLNTVGLDLGL